MTRSMTSRLSFIVLLFKVNLEVMLKVTRVNIPLMSCRTQGGISRRPEGEFIRPKRDLRFRVKILGLKIRYEIRG